jgi:hypothetical protein
VRFCWDVWVCVSGCGGGSEWEALLEWYMDLFLVLSTFALLCFFVLGDIASYERERERERVCVCG